MSKYLLAILSKKSDICKTSPQSYKIFSFFIVSCIFYFVEQIKKKCSTERNKRFKPLKSLMFPLTLKLSRPRGKGRGEVLEFVTCLQILLFLINKSIVHFCGWWVGGLWWFADVIILWSLISKLT